MAAKVPNPVQDATQVLVLARRGDSAAENRLWPLIYGQLRALAADYLRREPPDDPLQATALVHEAYLRLVDQTAVDEDDRSHFFAIAAQAMRRVLLDNARRRRAHKRGGAWQKITLSEEVAVTAERDVDLEALDEALSKLFDLNARQARVVELRFFGGMTIEVSARVLGVSTATVENDWRIARAWLRRELRKGE